ncbi:MAG: hypothetical protein O2815_02640 [Actinomycetota bacterium]|nr:hypothetical protein [Actinomycetota bacterium]
MRIRARVFVAAVAAAVLPLAFTPTASADTYEYMNSTELEQAVLRAQPGVGLGKWTQNFYFQNSKGEAASALRPLVCPTMTRKNITLPKADTYGAVGYAVTPGITLSITIWQYKSEADAQAAMTRFMEITCPDTPRIAWEDGKYYEMDSGGGDFTSSEVKGVPALLKGYSGTADGVPVDVTWAVRPVGKAVVRVEAGMYGDAAKSRALQNRAPQLIGNWIDAASNAVLKFSSNDPNAA